ncbi:hypothetical protein DL771_004957 [Monosporascus sp. 5C6A]|nr:hypothetical protein DL771_004957 [Monosporascus sp. 5C6A]
MPGSSTRDSSPYSSSGGKRRNKRKEKLTGIDASGTKKKDKNAKDSGGVVAAVTRHAKFSNGGFANGMAPSPESLPVPSPEMKPAMPASIPTNGIPTISPPLDAVSTASASTSTAPSAGDWIKHTGPFGASPSNLISLMGDSPPTQPSSYEDQRPMPYAWSTRQRPYANSHGVTPSPPNSIPRPLSLQMESHFRTNDVRSQTSSPPDARRSSMNSPFGPPRGIANPPLPHQPQAHFYGAPDIDFDLGPNSGLKAGERGFYFGFDTLPSVNGLYSPGSDSVVLAGYEGGLDVYSVGKRGVDPIASLKGLRGGVYNAKILPWTAASDRADLFPLVAVVVHGPVIPVSGPEISVEGHFDESASPRLDGVRTPQSETNQRPPGIGKPAPVVEAYQTSVEVYSLKTNKLVDILLQAPVIPIKTSVSSPVFRSPPPTGTFHIRADRGSVAISSGVTGECWIYRQVGCDQEPGYQFRCAGKVWTSLQQGLKGDATPEEERSRSPVSSRRTPQMPILAVSGRWLAYCPPAPASQIALNASIPVPVEGKAPGLATLTSPVLPNESADVDQPISDGMMNRIMRETTQEFIQGARWVGKQGMQLWNNYWKPGQQSQARSPSVGSPPWGAGYTGRSDASQFPPTYGISGQAVTKDPGLVSILDMHSLANSTVIHHVTTFKAPLGCSFLSFSPTGLSLFTASSKGDVQTVWDLMRIQYTKSSPLQNSQSNHHHATRVRQIAQFSRMTVARIVDVAWARPNGERIAMVTERGTVHLLDMPPSAYTWPPPRRRTTPQPTGNPENATSAVSMASNALSSAYGAARPLISRHRRTSSNTQANPTIMNHASYGGKVLAAGISNSLGNAGTAINHLRHTGENRVSLPLGGMATPGPSCVTWVTGKKYHTLFVVGDGFVRTFPSKSRKTAMVKDGPRVPRGNRYRDFKLKYLPDDLIAPSIKKIIDRDDDLDLAAQEFDGGHTMVLAPQPRSQPPDLSPESSIPQAEIESSAPYQPFHTDRRIRLYEYGGERDKGFLDPISRGLEAATLEDRPKHAKPRQTQTQTKQVWAFGQAIDAVQVDVGLPSFMDEELGSTSVEDHRALPVSAMERVLQVGDNDEQIVVTTRRKRGGNRHEDGDEDEFFEDGLEIIDFADQRV